LNSLNNNSNILIINNNKIKKENDLLENKIKNLESKKNLNTSNSYNINNDRIKKLEIKNNKLINENKLLIEEIEKYKIKTNKIDFINTKIKNKNQIEYFMNILTTMVGSLNDLSSLLNKNILVDNDEIDESNEEIEENESKNSLINERESDY
jgi:hypothetical protein